MLLLVGCSSGDSGSRDESPRGTPRPGVPNLVLILTDDQWVSSLDEMPHVHELLATRGITFTNAFVTTPLCCPSRASILTGQYSHRTGVYDNKPPNGGAEAFRDRSSIATWLRKAGYTTSYVGKYLNGYKRVDHVPPGWDDWHVGSGLSDTGSGGIESAFFYNYVLNENGRKISYGDAPSDYLTTVLLRRSLEFIDRVRDPFFLVFAPLAPHAPAIPAPGDEERFVGEPPFRPRSFNEPDVADKPWGAKVPPLQPKAIEAIDRFRRMGLASLLSVDRAIAAIIDRLDKRGSLDNTVIVFTSDNGLLLGEHRLFQKTWAYEPSIRVPMIFRVPWQTSARRDDHLVLNIDLPATLAELAGATPDLPQNGRSLLPLLRGKSTSWREEILIEYLGSGPKPPRFNAIRTSRWKLIEYSDGSRELYDLKADPEELSSIAGQSRYRSIEQALIERLRTLAKE
jgi:arylsulfatase A-like enzyme